MRKLHNPLSHNSGVLVSGRGPPARPNVQVLLYFQVRAKNPNAGRPISRVTNELTGKTTVETEPEFIQSKPRSKTILVVFFG
jgi:hypothetical protein